MKEDETETSDLFGLLYWVRFQLVHLGRDLFFFTANTVVNLYIVAPLEWLKALFELLNVLKSCLNFLLFHSNSNNT